MKVDLPLAREVAMRVDRGAEHRVSVLDVDADTILVRVPPRLVVDEGPSRVTLAFGHHNMYWQVPTMVLAMYGAWWFLERPDEAACTKIQRRAFVRIAFETRVLVAPQGRDEAVALTTLNMSANGALAQGPDDLGAPGSRMTALIELPGQPTVSTSSQVVRVERNGVVRYGIHFFGMAQPMQEQLAQFVATQIQQSLKSGRDITLPRS